LRFCRLRRPSASQGHTSRLLAARNGGTSQTLCFKGKIQQRKREFLVILESVSALAVDFPRLAGRLDEEWPPAGRFEGALLREP
jgi:hypothetical protein